MGRVNTPILTPAQRIELESGIRTGSSHCFRMRCQAILLKSEGRTSKEVGYITGMCHINVNSWTKRFISNGKQGLKTQPGRGCKAIISVIEDKAAILRAITENRQRLQTAKAAWKSESGKTMCRNTFRAFLKTLVEDISG